MTGGKRSRDRGVRGERDLCKRLGAKRVGVAYIENPVDVETDFANYQVKNYQTPPSINKIYKALKLIPEGKNRYVVVKVDRTWLVVESLEQHQGDHGEVKEAQR
jgi:hypothetical protein